MIALFAVAGVTLGTLGLGTFGVRLARTTSDLLVASRAITPWWNAAAISGEYLSAASFLGIAGLEMQNGTVALWQSLGFTAGYLALLLFVAAPLRRFGSFTIPDFAEARLRSVGLRALASGVVLLIGGFYLVPQLKGAGIALGVVTGAPYFVGVVAVALVVTLNVGLGGMRGITYVQAYQFWLKVFAIALPACLLLVHFGGLPARAALFGDQLPRAGVHGLEITLSGSQRVVFPTAAHYRIAGAARVAADGAHVTLPAGRLWLPPHTAVPVASGTTALRGSQWSRPVGGSGQRSALFVYSLLIATFLGTMGLPHILVRFYTNPDGARARRTTVRVLGLLGLFYLFPTVYGAIGRSVVPQLYTTGQTDTVVLRLPQAAWPGTVGDLLGALTAAGAFAAFLSTSSGLLVSIAGTISHDVWPRLARGGPASVAVRRIRFRIAAALGILAPVAVAFAARGVDISLLVGWAFALAASSFCPLFVLGIWWPGLTARAAGAGMIAGTLLATGGIFAGLALGEPDNVAGALLAQPAIVSVPVAFAAMIGLSLYRRPTAAPVAEMLALHAPEGLDLPVREPAAFA
ncbi:MAG TPA: cation acetate symporter [Solirubrobacteraceae bacterium]|jgi:Na+(H+)/acetate symporter ActP|nr:cation acetate symporter [Solirubrobacteraceae bacterium]